MLIIKVEFNYFVWIWYNNYLIVYMFFNINFIICFYYILNKMMEKCIFVNLDNFFKVIRCKLFVFFLVYNLIIYLVVFKVCLEK